ncbi:NAD(P)-dependent alcohol dehydrogenase [Nocardioides sp. YIM 152315]|uniref:NAD(P)-dependent alcohol dehydrogenase n=1 Tax=Nocardioides sp. YIM 152315 TaxID=3031760 RepID=UPI0023DC6098|nr:NAD(P)-dependent alcohol dehydrogenase [Nocardioides sp. YIM 152315]MDF1604429.1 NAD(P)-dependent alcohol dehydrogenase [Nocardioides sp. YIM 152315]
MKALVQDRYGSPNVLRIQEVPTPVAGADEVLVRVRAASVNARDWHLMRGEPRLARLDRTTFGLRAPRSRIRGTDFAGTVESVGSGVTAWRPGDGVYGEADGALAEQVAARADVIAAKPDSATWEEAAAIPLAATTALTLLRAVDTEAGQRVLVNGASGGVGTFAVQLAKSAGLHVTAVCSGRNAELVGSLGADVVVDYGRQDFATTGERHDLVVDLVGNRSLRDLRRALAPTGTLVLSGGGVSGQGRFVGPLGLMTRAQVVARLSGLRVKVPMAVPSGDDLAELAARVDAGSLRPVVERTFALDDAAEAIRYLEVEHARAKVVVTVG